MKTTTKTFHSFFVSILSAGLACTVAPLAYAQDVAPDATTDAGSTYYVSISGSNGDARTPQTAWRELDRIDWARIRPGDTIVIREGTYTTELDVNASGTAQQPITIRAEGPVNLFGGRSTPLPYCGQSSWRGESSEQLAVDMRDVSYIILDGGAIDGIKINGWVRGMEFNEGSNHILVRHTQITDNGTVTSYNGGVRPMEEGVQIAGSSNVTFELVSVHDNGADAFQSTGGVENFTIRDSWVYNARKDKDGEVFNACTHPDGLQVNGAPTTRNITLERSVFGPGIYHTFLQNGGTSASHIFRDLLIYDALTSTIAVRTTGATDWQIDQVTSIVPSGRPNIELTGKGHTISNSIFVGGSISKLPGDVTLNNNYQHNVSGTSVGTRLDPQFRDPSATDYAPLANVNGAGSRVLSPFGRPFTSGDLVPPTDPQARPVATRRVYLPLVTANR